MRSCEYGLVGLPPVLTFLRVRNARVQAADSLAKIAQAIAVLARFSDTNVGSRGERFSRQSLPKPFKILYFCKQSTWLAASGHLQLS
jgi:hypothetical protein